MKNVFVPGQYVNACMNTIDSLKQHASFNKIKLLIYCAIAIRFYKEKIVQQIPAPVPKNSLDKEYAMNDFEELKQRHADNLDLGSTVGNQASKLFHARNQI